MNKTIIINMNGVVFHIEEDAYEILKSYMTEVKRHFYNSADSLEITTDIENRIAEMFTEQLANGNKQVITEQDVQYVIAQMGSVEDFDLNDDDSTAGATASASSAAYTSSSDSRKLFRDPDDHILGGVCAGLGSYFDIETVWVRLAFAVAFIFGGTGLLVYIILWIIVPKAVTRADRMSMRGEKLNLQGFKRNFEEEMGSVKSHFATLHEEARPLIHKTKAFAGTAAQHTGELIGDAGRAIAKLLAVIISIFCCLGIVSILVGIIAFVGYGVTSFGPGGFENIFPMNVIDYQHNLLFFAAAFFTMAIPLLTIMLLVLSAAFNRARFAKTTGLSMLVVWLIAVGVVIFYSARIASEFKESASFTQTLNIKPDSTNTYYLKLNDIKFLSAEDSARLDIKNKFNGKTIINSDEDNFNGPGHSIDIYIEKSDVSRPLLEQTYSARGNSYTNALMNARNSTYLFDQQDSVLRFGNRLQVNSGYLWRNQAITLTLKVPVNSKLIIDDHLKSYIRDVDFYECEEQNKHEHDEKLTFLMTDDGLHCSVDTLQTSVKNQ